MKQSKGFKAYLGILASYLIAGIRRKQRLSSLDLKHAEFKTSTQSMGLHMTDHMRDVFRFKWLRNR